MYFATTSSVHLRMLNAPTVINFELAFGISIVGGRGHKPVHHVLARESVGRV
jgi:hypothetical protein